MIKDTHDFLRDQYKKRLNSILQERGKATQIVEETDIPKTSISTWKNPDRTPIPDVVDGARLARACGYTVENMVFGTKNDETFDNHYLLDLVKRYQPVIENLEIMDSLTRNTLLVQIEAVAEEVRKREKKTSG